MSSPKINKPGHRLILLGIDGLDWERVGPLIEAGQLPHLERLSRQGILSRISGEQPVGRLSSWATIASGVTPDEHGLLTECSPPFPNTQFPGLLNKSWSVPPFWEAIAAADKKCHIIGWPGSEPLHPKGNGIRISDRYWNQQTLTSGNRSDVGQGILPESLIDEFKEFRWHPKEFSPADLRPFIQAIEEVDLNVDPRPWHLAHSLANAISIQAVATHALQDDWQFAAVHIPGLDQILNQFHLYEPPRMPEVAEDDFRRYACVTREAIKLFDQFVGALTALAGLDANLVVLSLYGYPQDSQRISKKDDEHVMHVDVRNPTGFLALSGPAFRSDEWIFGAHLTDIAPTVLAAMGVSLPKGRPGRVLIQAFTNEPSIAFYDPVTPIQSLVTPDLSKITPKESDQELSTDETLALDAAYRLALRWLRSGRVKKALATLLQIIRIQPYRLGPALDQIQCLTMLRRVPEALVVLNTLEQRPQKGLRLRDGLKPKIVPEYDLLRALLFAHLGDRSASESSLKRAESSGSKSAGYHARVGDARLALHQWSAAQAAYEKSVDARPHDGSVWLALAKARYRQRLFTNTVDACLEALALNPFQLESHLILGLALGHLQRIPESIAAFQQSLNLNASCRLAHRALALLYGKQPNDQGRATIHRGLGRLPAN